MSDENPVLSERRGAVLLITLNRPDRLNAWTDGLENAYFDALAAGAADAEVKAIVVTGAGKGFCAGADMQRLSGISESGAAPSTGRKKTFPLSIPKPVVGAINGACAGLGLVEALMLDVRFAAPSAKFTTAFAKLGLIAEHGVSWLLPRVVGTSNALDLLMSSRIITAEEAHRIGLVNHVSDEGAVLDDALAYAEQVASTVSPKAIAVMKRQVYSHWSSDLEAALADSNDLMSEALAGPELGEGVRAFTEKRAPRFEGVAEQV
ncbi:enoyl-CoA hydratase-related protein [Cumulibacter manganitolerans]|uniref:enoyl-CoA hydratase-related protein n=1 Tax=Cumulibacter manganitolerans TaxID=1884992 RepID=UPI001297D6F7|nr:enoyl-CoA hydratase-related protein [Cumulibacter manganitolerans]